MLVNEVVPTYDAEVVAGVGLVKEAIWRSPGAPSGAPSGAPRVPGTPRVGAGVGAEPLAMEVGRRVVP